MARIVSADALAGQRADLFAGTDLLHRYAAVFARHYPQIRCHALNSFSAVNMDKDS